MISAVHSLAYSIVPSRLFRGPVSVLDYRLAYVPNFPLFRGDGVHIDTIIPSQRNQSLTQMPASPDSFSLSPDHQTCVYTSREKTHVYELCPP